MKLLTVNPRFLKERCSQRGYSLEEVMPCVVDKIDDLWVIDVEHKAYPHPKNTTSSKAVVTDHPRNKKEEVKEGAGLELKKLLSYREN